jgi:hypothetical protein
MEVPCRSDLYCLRMSFGDNCPGCAMHPFHSTGLVFDRATGERLQLSDILSKSQINRIIPIASKAYQKRYRPSFQSRPSIRYITESWIPLNKGLWVQFSKYSFGANDFEVTIPWRESAKDPSPE